MLITTFSGVSFSWPIPLTGRGAPPCHSLGVQRPLGRLTSVLGQEGGMQASTDGILLGIARLHGPLVSLVGAVRPTRTSPAFRCWEGLPHPKRGQLLCKDRRHADSATCKLLSWSPRLALTSPYWAAAGRGPSNPLTCSFSSGLHLGYLQNGFMCGRNSVIYNMRPGRKLCRF